LFYFSFFFPTFSVFPFSLFPFHFSLFPFPFPFSFFPTFSTFFRFFKGGLGGREATPNKKMERGRKRKTMIKEIYLKPQINWYKTMLQKREIIKAREQKVGKMPSFLVKKTEYDYDDDEYSYLDKLIQ
jgi:hypothetical protein